MANKLAKYTVTGQYVNGKSTVAYELKSLKTGETKRVTREQLILLIGRGEIANLSAQLYQDKVLIRATDGELSSLPKIADTGARAIMTPNRATQVLMGRALEIGKVANVSQRYNRINALDMRKAIVNISKDITGYFEMHELASIVHDYKTNNALNFEQFPGVGKSISVIEKEYTEDLRTHLNDFYKRFTAQINGRESFKFSSSDDNLAADCELILILLAGYIGDCLNRAERGGSI